MAGGFIALQRQILDWEWYKTGPTKDVFIHLLLTANFTETRYKGITVKRGQVLTSINSLATNLGLTIQQTRTALEHLISTGEITNEANPQYRIITVVKYDDYQRATNESTNEQQTSNKRSNKRTTNEATNEQQHNNNNNNNNNVTNLTREQYRETHTPPDVLFDRFWELYPKKVSKPDAMKAWKAIDIDRLFPGIMDGLRRWVASYDWQKEGGRYIPYPATWLRRQQWNDMIEIPMPQTTQQTPSPAPRPPVKQSSSHNFDERPFDQQEYDRQMMDDLAAEIRKAREDGIL